MADLELYKFYEVNDGPRWIMFHFYENTQIGDIIDGYVKDAGNFVTNFVKSDDAAALKTDSANVETPEGSSGNAAVASFANDLWEKMKKDGVSTKSTTTNADSYKFAIVMPMTNSSEEKMSHSYDGQVGPIASVLDGSAGGPSVIRKLGETVKGFVDPAMAAINTYSKFSGSTAIITNADKSAVYTGGVLREFAVDWIIIPKSAAEAKNLFKIIRQFKLAASPDSGTTKVFLRAPMSVKLEFSNELLDDNMRFKDMVITSVEVNYSLGGYMEVFHDGTPKAISLNVGFQERRMKTREMWEDGYKD